MASAYLVKTGISAGNRRTWTWSGWVKRASLGEQRIFNHEQSSGTSQISVLKWDGSDKILYVDNSGSGNSINLNSSNMVFRDVGAWYHIVLRIDTTDATANNRARIYINGQDIHSELGSFSTHTQPSQNYDTFANQSGNKITIGAWVNSTSQYFDGSMTHIHFCDGYSYAPTSFGETDSTSGIWKPKTAPSVTYGTNGFFLKMENSGAMGTDSSGNSNTFTVNGTLTQNVDTPSNNFATLNPLMNPYGGNDSSAFSNGNLSFLNATTDYSGLASLGVINGKWYWEVKSVNQASTRAVGIVRADKISINTTYGFYISDNTVQTDFTASYRGTGLASVKLTGARTTTDTGVTYGTGDIIGIALDLSSVQKTIKYYKNGSIVNTTNLDDSFVDDFVLPAFRIDATQSMDFNFGQGYFGTTAVASAGTAPSEGGIFEYDCPSGYQALCTKGINSF